MAGSFGQARQAVKRVREAWAALGTMLSRADSTLRSAESAVDDAVAAVIDDAIGSSMANTPSYRLAEYGGRVGALERVGLNTVAQVAAKSKFELLRYPGIGEVTAQAAVEAVAKFRADVEGRTRVLPDPDRRRAHDTDLLVALDRYDQARRAYEPQLTQYAQWRDQTKPAIDAALSTHHTLGLLFSRKRREAAVAAATPLADQLEVVNEQAEVLASPPPGAAEPSELWSRYERNAASFVATLEQVRGRTRVGAPARGRLGDLSTPPLPAVPKPDLRGGLPAEIADAVEGLVLDPGPLTATLRQYQKFGSQYIVQRERALIGDDMGLGKTVEVLAAMCHLHANGHRHFFVVAPNSVLLNWEREVAKHTGLEAFIIHGQGVRMTRLREWRARGGVAVTTYGTLGAVADSIGDVDLLAADEAHLVKNPGAQRTRVFKDLTKRAKYLALLTGTALENRVSELHGLVTLTQPTMSQQVAMLVRSHVPDPFVARQRLAPVYLRRTQADVLTELPECEETQEWVELTGEDRRAYEECPPDPMLKRRAATVAGGTLDAPKYVRLRELLDAYREEGRKVVVFSTFRQVLDDVSAIAGGCEQINGSVAAGVRQDIIDAFSQADGFAVLASQIDAGGLGINLQAAQVVILMEPQYKPSTEQQAIARVHRMGQTRRVLVHRILAKNTIEEPLLALIAQKADLFEQYAHHSSVKDASAMATDASVVNIEAELRALLEAEASASRRNEPS